MLGSCLIGIEDVMLSDDGINTAKLDGTFLYSDSARIFFVLSMLLLFELLFDEL